VDVGTELPPGIELRPVPDEVTARVPQTRDYRYAVRNGRVLLVGMSRIVVGVFGDANEPVSLSKFCSNVVAPAHSASKTRVKRAYAWGPIITPSGIWVPAFAGSTRRRDAELITNSV
jgi:hypothetical protein